MTLDLVKRASEAIWGHIDYDKYYNGLVDLRQCQFAMPLKDLIKMVAFFSKNKNTSKGFLVILTNDSENIAKSLIFNSKVGALMNIHVAGHIDSALRNLRITKEDYEKAKLQKQQVIE